MWRVRVAMRRRWSVLAAVLLTLAVAALVSGPWSPAAELGRASAGPALPLKAPSASQPPLEFYGAARNLFSSASRPVTEPGAPAPPAPAAGAPSQTAPSLGEPSSQAPPAGLVSPSDLNGPAALGRPKERSFEGYDREVDRVEAADVPPLSDDWLRDRERVYAERRHRLRRTCERLHIRLADSNTERSVLPQPSEPSDSPVEQVKLTHFTVVPPLKTMTCLVNKAASTSLLATFLKLTGHGVPMFSAEPSPHSIAKVLHPTKPGQFELAKKQYFKFMFVRHPLERLISAYEDKVVRANHPSLLALRRSILATHEDLYIRQRVYELLRAGTGNDTALLADYDAQLAEYRGQVEQRHGVPTFAEFLDFVLASEPTGDTFDSHWTPYWRQCAPCHMDYDVIGMLETGADDFKYMWHRMKIYSSVRIPRQNALQRNSTALEEHARRYLAPVHPATVARLGHRFRLDFELFGYDWEQMLRLSGHCAATGRCVLA
ncbi:carbohydrate sulfotransferase 14-like [Pollicipes pollicipes]|uniref:carbohydrate sulfotransferase 14-like n=1 Tax=Pollicipes pollicipes TaxID=41117 RepID=UPI001885638D|nr:carbohydrate sulfotransferase 14-like [Pollicipes pollicipes]